MTARAAIRLTVVGDSLLDIDAVGRVDRVCPDAPVPVVDEIVEHPRPGGAALAAMMAARDGHDVQLVTAWGDDQAGDRLAELLVDVTVIRVPYDGPTPVKYRVRSGGQSIVRLDRGTDLGTFGALPTDVEHAVAAADAVLVSDYGRGITGVDELRDVLSRRPRPTPLVWDPHPRGSQPVAGAQLVTPNSTEAADWADRRGRRQRVGSALATAAHHADALVDGWRVGAVAVTMSARGALLSYGYGAPVVVPAPEVDCRDACGAGDRFASAAAIALGSGLIPAEAVQAAVTAASAYVASGGPASLVAASEAPLDDLPPTDADSRVPSERSVEAVLRRVRHDGGVVVATGGCFDLLHAGHVSALTAARSLGDCLVVCLNSDASVRRLKGDNRPLVPMPDRVEVLEALECVDAVVVFDESTPLEALRVLRPDIWVKGGDYAGRDVPEAEVLVEWGGQTVVVPYLAGRSTTHLVESAGRSSTTTTTSSKEMSS